MHSKVGRLAFVPDSEYVDDSGHHVTIFEAPNRLHLDRDVLLNSEPRRDLALTP